MSKAQSNAVVLAAIQAKDPVIGKLVQSGLLTLQAGAAAAGVVANAVSAPAKAEPKAQEVKPDSVRRIDDYLGNQMVEVALSGKRPKNMSLGFYNAFREACVSGRLKAI